MKPIQIVANITPFDHFETHYVDIGFNEEYTITLDGNFNPTGTPLPSWKEIKHLSDDDLRTTINEKSEEKEDTHVETPQPKCIKVFLPNGRMIYCL